MQIEENKFLTDSGYESSSLRRCFFSEVVLKNETNCIFAEKIEIKLLLHIL